MAEVVQLAGIFNPDKHMSKVKGWLWSEKLDGMRAWWDGGVSRGKRMSEVPWANTLKGENFICTGLWSRLGNVIHAPDDWLLQRGLLNCPFPVDGEGWMGPRKFQQTLSIMRSHNAPVSEWAKVGYMAFDAPPPLHLFAAREVRVNNNQKYWIKDGIEWVQQQGLVLPKCAVTTMPFVDRQKFLLTHFSGAILRQESIESEGTLADALSVVMESGGEGLVVKDPGSYWHTKRDTRSVLKYKPFEDTEGVVQGWTRGLGKFDRMMGSLSVREVLSESQLSDYYFNVSGFTDDERQLITTEQGPWPYKFPLHMRIRIRYTGGRTDDGIPRDARYFR